MICHQYHCKEDIKACYKHPVQYQGNDQTGESESVQSVVKQRSR